MFYRLWREYIQLPLTLRLFLLVIIFMFLFGFLIYLLEPNQFHSIFDGIWWAFITGSTVGYGDLVPETYWGRVIALILILIGGGTFAFLIATIASGTVQMKSELNEGKKTFNHEDHFIVVGWNERTRMLIDIFDHELKGNEKLVLIDDSLEKDPANNHFLHFINGDPTTDEPWIKANIKEANKIIITADQSLVEKESDRLSILSTITARGLNDNIPIIAEILTKEQVINAQRAGATDVISSNETTGTLFFHELIGHQHTQVFEYVKSLLSQQRFRLVTKEEWVGETILKISFELKKEGYLLLGIVYNYDIEINPPPERKITKDDGLIITKSLL